MNRMDYWAGMALAGLCTRGDIPVSTGHAHRAWELAEAMENERIGMASDFDSKAEESSRVEANEAVAELVHELGRESRRIRSTVKTLTSTLTVSDPDPSGEAFSSVLDA